MEGQTDTTAVPLTRAVAAYLTEVRGFVGDVAKSRQILIQGLGQLIDLGQRGDPTAVVQTAGRIGREKGALFRAHRSKLMAIKPPPPAVAAHEAVAGWLEMMIAACDVLDDVGTSGKLGQLRTVQSLLAEGRGHSRQFNSEYNRLVEYLKQRAAERSVRQRAKSVLRRIVRPSGGAPQP